MENGGIIRRIDELGRIVIPKEMRKSLRINVGDKMEICASLDGIVLKKRSGYESIMNIVKEVSKTLAFYTKADVIALGSSDVVYSAGERKNDYIGGAASGVLLGAISNRKEVVLHGDDLKRAFDNVECSRAYLVFQPIVVDGDSLGGLALLLDTFPSDLTRSYLKFVAELIEDSLK